MRWFDVCLLIGLVLLYGLTEGARERRLTEAWEWDG